MNDGDEIIIGRAEIAHRLGVDEKTTSRWIAAGALPARKAGPFANSPLVVRAADLDDLAARFHRAGGDD